MIDNLQVKFKLFNFAMQRYVHLLNFQNKLYKILISNFLIAELWARGLN